MGNGEVRAVSEQVERVKSDLMTKANEILGSVDRLKSTYEQEVVTERGLVGGRANQLTDWFNTWYTTFKTKTENELSEFRGQVDSTCRDIMAAGGS
jgi:hypothetical protein